MGGVETGANVEYFFRLIYDCFRGACYGGVPNVGSLAAELWLWITLIGYILAVVGLFFIVYATVKLFELRHREEEQLGTLILAPEKAGGNPRWAHIESLMASENPSDWRQAIIEADILLDDMLMRQGYAGE